MIPINTITDLENVINNPYRMGEYLTDGTQIFDVSDDMNENQCLIETYDNEEDVLFYDINYEDDNLYTENGKKIEMIY